MVDRIEEFKALILDGAAELPPDVEIEFRKMFGGIGAYARGRFFATTCAEGFALKLADEDIEALLKEPGAMMLQHTPGIVERHYVVVPPGVVADKSKLRGWIERSIAHVQTLPLPKRKKR